MDGNQNIADRFATGGFEFFKTQKAQFEPVALHKQGSAAEGLRVRGSDFDYAMDVKLRSAASFTESRNVPGHGTGAAGRWEIRSKEGPLSPDGVTQDVQGHMDKYVNQWNKSNPANPVMKSSKRMNPAYNVRIKTDQSHIDVDLVPVITSPDGQRLIRKTPANATPEQRQQWFSTKTKTETRYVKSLGENQKQTCRDAKAALKDKNIPTYHTKTAWLREVDRHPSPKDWDTAAKRDERLVGITEELEKGYSSGNMASRFDKSENLLAHHNQEALSNKAGYFRHHNNRWKNGDQKGYKNKLASTRGRAGSIGGSSYGSIGFPLSTRRIPPRFPISKWLLYGTVTCVTFVVVKRLGSSSTSEIFRSTKFSDKSSWYYKTGGIVLSSCCYVCWPILGKFPLKKFSVKSLCYGKTCGIVLRLCYLAYSSISLSTAPAIRPCFGGQ